MISTRNQLVGKVIGIERGAVNGTVTIKSGDEEIKAVITMEAISELDLSEGVDAAAVIKATNVMFASGSEPIGNLTACNQFPGVIKEFTEGAVNGQIALSLPDGNTIGGSITNDAIDELGLVEGSPAVAIVRETDVMVATL